MAKLHFKIHDLMMSVKLSLMQRNDIYPEIKIIEIIPPVRTAYPQLTYR